MSRGSGSAVSVSIVIPAYNEAQRIGWCVREIQRFLERSRLDAEIIVVDDGSQDDTSRIVQEFEDSRLRLIRNARNSGKGFAVRLGVLAAGRSYVLFTDADLSAPIEEIEKLLDVARRESADIVIGSRAVDRSMIRVHQPPVRELGGVAFNKVVQLLLGLRLHDTQCGFKLFHRERTREVFDKQTRRGFGFDPELLFLAKQHGLRVREVPVSWSHSEDTKMRLLRDGTDMVWDILRIRWNWLCGRYR